MANTIPALKRSFLASQVRILNTPLEAPQNWREAEPSPEAGHLSDKVVDEAVGKVNKLIKQHNASVFPAQALSHVAQQIDALYWSAAAPDIEREEIPLNAISVDADLRDEATIASLPPTLPSSPPAPSSPSDVRPAKRPRQSSRPSTLETFDASTRYARLRTRLQELNEQRKESRQKLEQIKALEEAVAPFRDAKVNVQPNLMAGKAEGELERELERMKVLGARLIGRLREKRKDLVEEGRRGMEEDGGKGSGDMEVERKLDTVMGLR